MRIRDVLVTAPSFESDGQCLEQGSLPTTELRANEKMSTEGTRNYLVWPLPPTLEVVVEIDYGPPKFDIMPPYYN